MMDNSLAEFTETINWQIFGHILLSTQTVTPICQVGVVVECWSHMPEGSTPNMGGGIFSFCQKNSIRKKGYDTTFSNEVSPLVESLYCTRGFFFRIDRIH